MTRVLVVHPDVAVADREASAFQTAGYEVERCPGPLATPCPVLDDLPCPLLDRADVLVYDASVAGDHGGARRLIRHLRDTYVDLPVVLTGADVSLPWARSSGPHRVTPLGAAASADELLSAVAVALAEQGMAV